MSVTKIWPVNPDQGAYTSGAMSFLDFVSELNVAHATVSISTLDVANLVTSRTVIDPGFLNGTTNFWRGINITTVGAQTQNALLIQLNTDYIGSYPFGIIDHDQNDLVLITGTGQIISAATKIQIGLNNMTWGASSPAAGTWVRGDVCWNTGASGSGSPGWVCSAAGTPGTWKTMAVLGA